MFLNGFGFWVIETALKKYFNKTRGHWLALKELLYCWPSLYIQIDTTGPDICMTFFAIMDQVDTDRGTHSQANKRAESAPI